MMLMPESWRADGFPADVGWRWQEEDSRALHEAGSRATLLTRVR